MSFAFAASRPSCPRRLSASLPTQRSQRIPLTLRVSVMVAINVDATDAGSRSRTSRSASPIRSGSCVAQTTVVRVECASSASRAPIDSVVVASSRDVGSSASTTAGRAATTRASATRSRCPAERTSTRRSACSATPTVASACRARLVRLLTYDTAQRETEHHVLSRGERVGETRNLSENADSGCPQRSARVTVERRHRDLVQPDLPLVGHVQAGQEREQRRLARPRRAGDDRKLTGEEACVDAVERGLFPVSPRDRASLERRSGGAFGRNPDLDVLMATTVDGMKLDDAGTRDDDRPVADARSMQHVLGNPQPTAGSDDGRLLVALALRAESAVPDMGHLIGDLRPMRDRG